jgi:muramoyltetrapeptide carboxypeptidase LdcA involved in peptidoglycan recycling
MNHAQRLLTPPKVKRDDRVAVLSPSWAGPAVYPDVHDAGLRVLREDLGLVVVEYPTTRELGSSPKDRARDLMSAFADPTIRAVLASIGGDDQITVLPYLDRDVVAANPKAFVGFSDNTNLLNWLWTLGMTSYHGGSTLLHLARRGGVHEVALQSLRHALFDEGTFEITALERFTEEYRKWEEEPSLVEPLPTSPEPGWLWHQATKSVSGPTWGGNLEILHWNLAANRWILPVEEYAGCVLILETSEEMPSGEEVFRMLRDFGERGLLEQFPAVVVAKAKAWTTDRPLSDAEREQYRDDQRRAVLTVMATYNPDAMVVIGADFGHTDPQYVVPYGGAMTVDGPAQRITAQY